MSVPVVVAANGIGTPVKPVTSGAPSMTVATNGYGAPIVISDLGTPFVVNGLLTNFLSGTTWPETPQSQPVNLVPQPAGEMDTATGWTLPAGIAISGGKMVADGTNTGNPTNAQIDLTVPPVTGRSYGIVLAVENYVAGSVNPTVVFISSPASAISRNGVFARTRLLGATVTPPYTRLQFVPNSQLDVAYHRIYDLTSIAEKKWRIVPVYSQSNWVGSLNVPDPAIDVAEPRALLVPSRANNILGSSMDGGDVGVFMPLVDPVQHRTFATVPGAGAGPAGAFARTFCDGLRDDEVLVYVATGFSGGGRLSDDPLVDGTWNRHVNGNAWMNMLNQVDALLARAPQGSTIAGMMFCQGEADVSEITGDEHAIAIRGDFEILRARWGFNFPIVINEIGFSNLSIGNRQLMVDSHKKLDSNSGDALALPRCRYIPRPPGSVFLEDNTHYDQPTQRIRGELAAIALLDLNYE